MSDLLLNACKFLAETHGFFKIDKLMVKLRRQDYDTLRQEVLALSEHLYFVQDIIFMREFAPYADLFTLDLCVLAVLHQVVDPKNAEIQDHLLKKIRVIRNDL